MHWSCALVSLASLAAPVAGAFGVDTSNLSEHAARRMVASGDRSPFLVRIVRKDGCACSSQYACTSLGVDVSPFCGCQDFVGLGYSYCYVAEDDGACALAGSTTFPGARYRACVGPPPPPPAANACTDPLFPHQWHLHRLRAAAAWSFGRGNGSSVVVVDDGIQYSHPDLRVDSSRSFGWDFETGMRLPTADSASASHGTAVAGLASARAHNARGGCGIAPDATLVAVRLLSDAPETTVSDVSFVRTLEEFESDAGAVLSNSWGPPDDGRVDGPGARAWYARVDAALVRFASRGRAGRGGVVVFASGNGGRHDNANDDGFASHAGTIAVGSVGDDGRKTHYSEPGACLDVVAPSGGGWRGVTTADLVGSSGYADANFTTTFSGTSASAPMVAGIVAIMLGLRPELTLRDVRRILVQSAQKTDPGDVDWLVNAAGLSFNPWYGFGLVDAHRAAELTVSWTVVDLPSGSACSTEWHGYLPLVRGAVTVVPFPDLPTFEEVEDADVYVDVEHPWRGDVMLELISPANTTSVLTWPVPETVPLRDAAFVPHTYRSRAFLGENTSAHRHGVWSLALRDVTGRGHLQRARVCVHGLHNGTYERTYATPTARRTGLLRILVWSSIGASSFTSTLLLVWIKW